MSGGSMFQERTDKLVKELLEEMRRAAYTEEEKQQQPFDKESIKEFLMMELNEMKNNGATSKEIDEKKKTIVKETEELFNMCKGDLMYTLEERDTKRINAAKEQNRMTVFILCLTTEISRMQISPIKKENLKKERIEQFKKGIKVYDPTLLFAAEQAQIQLDKQMPEGMKKLIDINTIPKTYEIIASINERRNAPINGPINALKPKK